MKKRRMRNAGMILLMFVSANVFVLGCESQKKNVVQEQTSVSPEIQQAANELNKQIDVFSAEIKGATDVLKKEMPVISSKIQGLVSELQRATQEIQNSMNTTESSGAKK